MKDSAGAPAHRMVDVGQGTIDFRRIFARREQAGIRHYFVEHDDPPDPLAFARASYAVPAGAGALVPPLSRRALLRSAAGAAAGLTFPGAAVSLRGTVTAVARLKQSVSRWPFHEIPLPDFCRAAKAMGIEGIDLLQRDDWEAVRELGLVCSMGYPTGRRQFIETGFNDRGEPRDAAPGAGGDHSARGSPRGPQRHRHVRQPRGQDRRRGDRELRRRPPRPSSRSPRSIGSPSAWSC